MTRFSSASLEIEFSAGVWTDVSAYYRSPVRVRFGRPTQFDEVGAATLTARLDNPDGRFQPDFFGSPYYPYVVKDKRIRFKVTKDGVTYTRHVGWIVSWKAIFPTRSTNDAYVIVTSVDSLGKLAKKTLRSSWTEQNLWRVRANSTEGDAWEPVGQANGFYAFLTNFTEDSGHPGPVGIHYAGAPALSFSTDRLSSFGQIVTVSPDSSQHSSATRSGIDPGALRIMFMYKSPRDFVPATSTPYTFATLLDSGANRLCNLVIADNGSSNAFYVYDANLTSSLAFVGNVGYDQWHVINMSQNGTTSSHMDFGMVRCDDGSAIAHNDVNVDIRNVSYVEWPGYLGQCLPQSYGGLIALQTGAVGLQDYEYGITTASTTLSERIASLAGACSRLPVSFTNVGTWTALACTGDWSGRSALAVGNEICRSNRNGTTGSTGVLFGRPKDSQVLAISGSATRPSTPVASISVAGDALKGLDLAEAVASRPTSVLVESAQVRVLLRDDTAEADGESRSATISTINRAGYSDAADIANFYLTRYDGVKFSKVRIDLTSAANDPTAALFDESGTNTGLFPTAKIRLTDLPGSHFTHPTRDVFVEGWEEVYDKSGIAYIDAETSPAQTQTLASDNFTGTDGAGWSATWNAGTGSATWTLLSNRGLGTPPATANAYASRRIVLAPRADGELTGSIILNNSASQGHAWLRGSSGLVNGYNLRMNCSGTLVIEQVISTVVTEIASFAKTLTAGTQYGWRIRVVDEFINARVWVWGSNEHSTWDFDLTDDGITAAGYAGVGIQQDATTTPRTVTWDDVIFTDAAANSPNQ